MAASASDYLTKVGSPGTATTLAAPGHTSGGTSLTVVSTSNWPTTTGTIFAMDTVSIVNGVEVRDVGSYREYEGVVASSTSITGVTSRYGSDRDFAAGSTTRVYIPVAGSQNDRMVDGLTTAGINQDGTQTPVVKTSINDINSNELFKVTATASAVNELTIANAATGSGPTLSATGGDTNVDINLTPKGTGVVKIGGNTIGAGAWGSWTPTMATLTIGNGTLSGTYSQIGKTVIFDFSLVFGSTTSISGSSFTSSLPVTPATRYAAADTLLIGYANAYDLSATAFYLTHMIPSGSNLVKFLTWRSDTGVNANFLGTGSVINSTTPITFATGDKIYGTGRYEAA